MSFLEIFRFLPGFRFRPTDEELVSYYLRKKVCGRVLPYEVIAEVDLYKFEPWDLPEKSALPSRDLEWYFFIPRDRKYANGSRSNRATAKGYWKSTGKDRSVTSKSRAMGTKKTLVYYKGRAPKGERTNWVMHEYRLNDVECRRIHAEENGFVLCRVYEKSGPGPRNGEQYGAPVEDNEFEDSPTVEADGSGSIKLSPFERGPSSTSVYNGESLMSGHDNDAVSQGLDVVSREIPCLGFEPRNLNAHFKQSYGDFREGSIPNYESSANGGPMFSANGELVESAVVAPTITGEEEAAMLEQLLGECENQLEFADGYQDVHTSPDFGQPGAHPSSDGDFLELDDLASASDSEEGNSFGKANNVRFGSRDDSGDSQCSLMRALLTFEERGQWPNLPFEDGVCEGQQMVPEAMQMQSSLSTVTYDFHHQQPSVNNISGSFPLSPAVYEKDLGSAVEPEDENVRKFLDRLNACTDEKGLAENLIRGLFEPEDISALPLQDGHYFDAIPSFLDADVCADGTDTILQATFHDGISQGTLAQASSLARKVEEALDKPEHLDKVLQAKDLVPEHSGETVRLEQGMHSPRSLSLFLRWMDSLPTTPASAAELSPKATSTRRSLRVTATSVGVGEVSITCKCIGEGIPSSCVNCSVAEVEKKGRFVKSLSFVGQRKLSMTNRWKMGFSISAVFGGLLAIFVGVLITTGAWRFLGGVYT